MTASYAVTSLAESDLDGTWDYVAANFNFDLADQFLDSHHGALKLLAENPNIGHAREDIGRLP